MPTFVLLQRDTRSIPHNVPAMGKMAATQLIQNSHRFGLHKQ